MFMLFKIVQAVTQSWAKSKPVLQILLVFTLVHVEGTCSSQSFKEKKNKSKPHTIRPKLSSFPVLHQKCTRTSEKLGWLGKLKA